MKDYLFKMPTKIRYGEGLAGRLGEVVKELGHEEVFIVTGPTVSKSFGFKSIIDSLMKEAIRYEIYDSLESEPTVEQIDFAALKLKQSSATLVLSIGGGSRIDAAKAMCLLKTHEGSISDYLFGGTKTVTNKVIPQVCIPTTAGTGSEVTGVSVVSDEARGVKVSVNHEYLIPIIAIIDPKLHLDMPAFITATTGMDALTHAIEAYVSLNAEPISDMFALSAIKMIGNSLRKVINDGNDLDARAEMAIASTIAGVAFANGGLGLVHGIAQSMGAVAHVTHGVGNGLILPYAMKVNAKGNPKKFAEIATALGEDLSGLSEYESSCKAADAVFALAKDIGIPMKLSNVGITKEMFPEIIKGTMEYRLLAINPVKVTEQDVLDILTEAF
jgi:alcohol dehydrogenase